MRVLLLDDEVATGRALARVIRHLGVEEIVLATSADVALAAADRGPFDVVISDFTMPGMDGIDFLSEITRRRPDTRRFMITGNPEDPKVVAGLGSGIAAAVLEKPAEMEAVRRMLGIAQESTRP